MKSHTASWSAVAHFAILLAVVIPGPMTTSVRVVYLVTAVGLDPFIVGSFNYAAAFLSIVFLYYAARGHLDRINPIRLQLLALMFFVLSSLCLLTAGITPLFLVPAALFSAIASIGASAIFTYDEQYGPRGADSAGLFRTRLLLSAAWIVGPPLSFVAFWLAGFVSVIAATTALSVAAAIGMIVVGRRRQPLPRIEAPAKGAEGTKVRVLGFWPIFVVMVATTTANILHSINMPLYLIEVLDAPTFWPGFVMAAAAGVEVVIILLLPRLTAATSDETILWSGLILGIGYFALLNLVTDPALILACQLLYGGHFAATTVVCLPLLRQAMSGGTGSLAAQFSNAGRVGGLIGSALFAVLASRLGYQGILVFLCEGLLVFALLFGIVRWLTLRQR